MQQQATYEKEDAENIIANYLNDWVEWWDDGLFIQQDFSENDVSSSLFQWTPACNMEWDGAPDPKTPESHHRPDAVTIRAFKEPTIGAKSMNNSPKASMAPQRQSPTQPLTEQERERLLLAQHLRRLVDADPREAREALEMSQEHFPEICLTAQYEPRSNWAQAVMNSDSMHSLISRSPSQVKTLLEQPDLRSLLELLP